MELTETQFHERYTLEKNHLDSNAAYDGFMFETFGDEIKYVLSKVPEERVWTITECDEGKDWVVSAGYGIVNRIGYLITQEPWSDVYEHFVDQF